MSLPLTDGPHSGRGRSKDSVGPLLGRLNSRVELDEYAWRFRWIFIAFCIPLVVLVGRLWQLQIIDADIYTHKAHNNLIREVKQPATRGLIYDVAGTAIAENRPAYDVTITPRLLSRDPEALNRLGDFLNITQDELGKISRKMERAGDRSFVARRDITRDQVAVIESNHMDLPGIDVQARAQRYYPQNEYAAHMLGFMNEVNADELEELRAYGYEPGDYVGRMGLERRYEAILRGSPGFERQVVDARGIPQGDEEATELLGSTRRVQPVAGRNLVLTADMRLQQIMFEEFATHPSGAAVAINPNDGSVLAMLSKPTFNPNSWTGRLSTEEKRRSDSDPFKPMIDKTIQSQFPGSTFKIVAALAALNEGIITPDETLHCPGFYEFGKRRFHCWNHMGHGSVDLTDSLKDSCDVYYYKLGEKLGMDRLAQYGYMFGFGERTGVGINGESRGLVPTRDWHRKHSPEGFQYGFELSTAVGQGDTRVTPLQLALAYAAIANGGTLYYPRLVDRIESAQGRELFEYPGRVRHRLEVPSEMIKAIETGLTAAVNEPGSTPYKHRLDYVTVAGKTGTAQVRGFDSQNLIDGRVELAHRDHAWFAAYAPVGNPQIALVVFVEHGGSGGKVAAPVAMRILDRYFREILNVNPDEEKALALARTRKGPSRLRRPGAMARDAQWHRPGTGRDDGSAAYLFSNIREDEGTQGGGLTPPRRLHH